MNEIDPVPSSDTVAQVWPPPPTNAPPAVARPAFASLRGLARATVALLLIGLVVTVVQLLLPSGPTAATSAQQWVNLVNGLLSLGLIVVFLMWTYRLYRNLAAFGVSGLRWTPGWAVGYFFVPVMGLYRPLQIFQEIWRASDTQASEEGREWKRRKPPGSLLAWWLFWIGSQILAGVNATGTFNGNTSDLAGSLVVALSYVPATLLAVLVVLRLTARQEETARALSLLAA